MDNAAGPHRLYLLADIAPPRCAKIPRFRLEAVLVERPVLLALRDEVFAELVRAVDKVYARVSEPVKKGDKRSVKLALRQVFNVAGDCVD